MAPNIFVTESLHLCTVYNATQHSLIIAASYYLSGCNDVIMIQKRDFIDDFYSLAKKRKIFLKTKICPQTATAARYE